MLLPAAWIPSGSQGDRWYDIGDKPFEVGVPNSGGGGGGGGAGVAVKQEDGGTANGYDFGPAFVTS